MKKVFLLSTLLLVVLLLTGCGENKKLVCSLNGESNIKPEIVATLDSNGKVAEIEIRTIYETEEEAKKDFESFTLVHGENASIDKNVITVKNAHNPDTVFGKAYSKTVGYTPEEFETFLGNYTCK